MTDSIQILIFAAVGLAAGLAARAGFVRMPDAWLLDYDQTVAPPGFPARRAFPMLPQGMAFTILAGLLYARIPAAASGLFPRAAAAVAIPLLLLILVADWKTRIIPDQLTLLLLLPGLLQAIGHAVAGQSLAASFGLPLLAALTAGGALLAIGLLGQWLLHREAMGMGDVKLIAAAAFMVGWQHLLQLVMLSFFTAAIIAVPLLVRLRMAEYRNDQTAAAAGPSPAAGAAGAVNPEPAGATAAAGLAGADNPEPAGNATEDAAEDADPAEDPSAIAFGPFIAIAALLLFLFPAQIDQLASAYWSLILR